MLLNVIASLNLRQELCGTFLIKLLPRNIPREQLALSPGPDKPAPVKIALLREYIDRFYSSHDQEDVLHIEVDLTSPSSIQSCVRKVLASNVEDIENLASDINLLDLGLDSLGVFAIVKGLKIATGLGSKIAPRHVYADPTVDGLARLISDLATQAKIMATPKMARDDSTEDLQRAILSHKSRRSLRLNAFDYVNPNHGMGLVFYLPLQDGVQYEEVFTNLQQGLDRTFDLIPALSGKIMECSSQQFGYTQGDLCVSIPPQSMAEMAKGRLVYKDLTETLPSFAEMQEAGFPPSAFRDHMVLRDDPFPRMLADIFTGQVNFVKGGYLVAVDLNHCCLDGLGVMVALKAWAENCRFLQGDQSATCDWYDPESFNHDLPEILHAQSEHAKAVEDVDPGTWGFLPFFPPEDASISRISGARSAEGDRSPGSGLRTTAITRLPLRLDFPLHTIWPLPKAERCLKTTLFLIKPESLEQMKAEVTADGSCGGVVPSTSDIIQAFFWKAAIRARYRVATEHRNQSFEPDGRSIVEFPIDCRPYFSPYLPSTYMGSMLIMSRSSMPLAQLCSSDTSIAQVALVLRQTASLISSSLVHDAFTILQSLPDHNRFSTANMGLEHMNAMISNMMLFPRDEIRFGDRFFGNGGSPVSMRPQVERGNGRFRFLVILPLRLDGGVELALGTHPEELSMLQADPEFARYAELVDKGN